MERPSPPAQFILEMKEYKEVLETDLQMLEEVEDPSTEQAKEIEELTTEIEEVENVLDFLGVF